MDSDGQCDPRQIFKFWNARKKADLVVGYRIKRKDFLYRKFFSDFAKIVYGFFFKVKLKDPSFAFSLIRKDVYKSLQNFKIHLCQRDFFGNITLEQFIRVTKY